MKVKRLHFVTYDVPGISHASLAEEVLKGGVRLVQVRVKGRAIEEWIKMAAEVVEVCKKYGALCIVNDSVRVAKEVGADGVHLGMTDGSLDEARRVLGENAMIGASAASLDDLRRIRPGVVDYVGIGPYRWTTTKEDLSPLLGNEGIIDLVRGVNTISPDLPTVAIGGIRDSDVNQLLRLGVYGVAVASAIGGAEDRILATRKFLNAFDEAAI